MNKINVSKTICLNENYIFPECHVCKTEMKPFRIDSIELNKLSEETVLSYILKGLIRINAIEEDSHLFLLCPKCFSHVINVEK